jgi:type IV pilus assembly protein PilQ
MAHLRPLLTVLSAAVCSASLLQAQVPVAPKPVPVAPTGNFATPAPIDPVIETTGPRASAVTVPPVPPFQTTPATAGVVDPAAPTSIPAAPPSNASRIHEFQGDEIGLVLRSLARQAGMNIVVSDKVIGTVNMRLDNMTPREAIEVIVTSRGLFMDEQKGVFYIKTAEERLKEPAEAASFTFSYGQAKDIQPLLDKQLASGLPSQFDPRTNTIFFKETHTNMEKVLLFLNTVDRPTQQVMIEARLVEVTANPQQSYGINWAGVVGGATTPQTFRYGGSAPNPQSADQKFPQPNNKGLVNAVPNTPINSVKANLDSGTFSPFDFLLGGPGTSNALSALGGQFAILSVPQMSATLRFLNEDRDAEFLANPRVVTSNNQKAEIKITRAQPVPQLNFNEQTAQAVFSGFQDKEFGNTLVVTPVINKDNFISMNVKPEISNKVGDASFTFSGSTVVSPIIDKRTLESNVVIKSGDTLAIGGLLQDESTKSRTKVPFFGDIPMIGYLFQERLNSRTKRNLLVFVTPTIIKQGYGTGLEEQVAGVKHSGDEYADPNGWRNNAKGAVRLLPTSNRQIAADIPKPGVPPAPTKRGVVRTTVSSTTTVQ